MGWSASGCCTFIVESTWNPRCAGRAKIVGQETPSRRAGAMRCWQLLVPGFVESVPLNSTAIFRNLEHSNLSRKDGDVGHPLGAGHGWAPLGPNAGVERWWPLIRSFCWGRISFTLMARTFSWTLGTTFVCCHERTETKKSSRGKVSTREGRQNAAKVNLAAEDPCRACTYEDISSAIFLDLDLFVPPGQCHWPIPVRFFEPPLEDIPIQNVPVLVNQIFNPVSRSSTRLEPDDLSAAEAPTKDPSWDDDYLRGLSRTDILGVETLHRQS